MDAVPNIDSEAAVLMDMNSGAVLYNKNSEVKMYPASLTKIATAIYALEKGNLQDKVVVSKEATEVDGTRVYLEEGEVVTLEHLIQGMLINSGNDAAAAIAIHIDGSMEVFSSQINKFLEEKVKVYHTHFTNPHGLFDENHYTTAKDLAIITNYAMRNPDFKRIFGTKELSWDGKSWDTTLITHHLLLKGEIPYEEVTGGKTGYVNESKHTLATTAENDQIQLTAIVLKASDQNKAYADTQILLDYGLNNFYTEKVGKSATYQIGKNTFITNKDYYVTSTLNGPEREINSEGLLEMFGPTGDVIQTIQLEKDKPIAAVKDMKHVKNKFQWLEGVHAFSPNSLFIIAFFGVTTTVLSIRKWVLRK